ncbi:MAG: hypothetical protein AAB474_02105 [Patescibacteria group bacterium]
MVEKETFIPKIAPMAEKTLYQARGIGWLNTGAFILFAISLLISVGLFFYRGLIRGQINNLSATLQKVEGEFEPALIVELQQTALAINSIKNLTQKHVALSRLFKFLEENTIASVRFSNFSYNGGKVGLTGTARSYVALAEQSLIFEKSRLIKDVSFSNFVLSSGGLVNFNTIFTVQPDLIFYQPE